MCNVLKSQLGNELMRHIVEIKKEREREREKGTLCVLCSP